MLFSLFFFSRESNIYGSLCGLKRSKKLHCPGSSIHVRLWEQLLHVKDSALFCHLIREQFKWNNYIVIVVLYVSNMRHYIGEKKLIHIVEYIVSTRYHVDGVLVVSSNSYMGWNMKWLLGKVYVMACILIINAYLTASAFCPNVQSE